MNIANPVRTTLKFELPLPNPDLALSIWSSCEYPPRREKVEIAKPDSAASPELEVDPYFNRRGGLWELHSGESAPYNPKPYSRTQLPSSNFITVVFRNNGTEDKPDERSACCMSVSISDLLERWPKEKDVKLMTLTWEEWGSIARKTPETLRYHLGHFSASGRTLAPPVRMAVPPLREGGVDILIPPVAPRRADPTTIFGATSLALDVGKGRFYFTSPSAYPSEWNVGFSGKFPPDGSYVAMHPPSNVLAVYQNIAHPSYVPSERLIMRR